MGGSTVGAARRAARLADGFGPTNFKLIEDWQREMELLGKDWHPAMRYALRVPIGGATFTHLSQEPDVSWQRIREPLHYVVTAYAGWGKNHPGKPHPSGETPEDLLTTGAYLVMTPDDAVAQGKQMIAAKQRVRLSLQPMMGGIPWDEGQRSLDLATDIVLPQLQEFAASQ
jgi:alkanesulfonate monooxygenase SsuD/methylene tetrahydromethanopterin reductase-like flavin-dependent oxidoreductase (luciferase family)